MNANPSVEMQDAVGTPTEPILNDCPIGLSKMPPTTAVPDEDGKVSQL
jgi:hypothetical protein